MNRFTVACLAVARFLGVLLLAAGWLLSGLGRASTFLGTALRSAGKRSPGVRANVRRNPAPAPRVLAPVNLKVKALPAPVSTARAVAIPRTADEVLAYIATHPNVQFDKSGKLIVAKEAA